MRNRDKRTAERFGILNKVENLERDLLNIPGVIKAEFDLDGFYDNLNQVIVLAKYNVSGCDYWEKRRAIVSGIVETAARHGLKRTGDAIEDHGEHFYLVFSCNWEARKEAAV